MTSNLEASKMPGAPDNLFQRALTEALMATPLEGRPGSIEALYVAHFGDAARQGMWNGGVVVLETQRLFGGDSGYYYTGSYEVNGRTLTAVVTVQRHHAPWQSVWGDAKARFEIEIMAARHEGGAVIEGLMRRQDVPHIPLPLKLIRMTELPQAG